MKKILLIDDDDLTVEFTKVFLEDNSYIVKSSNTLKDAGEILSTWQPNIVITDIELEDGSGIEFAHMVNEMYGNQVLIFAISGHSFETLSSKQDIEIFTKYFTKPICFEHLLKEIQNI